MRKKDDLANGHTSAVNQFVKNPEMMKEVHMASAAVRSYMWIPNLPLVTATWHNELVHGLEQNQFLVNLEAVPMTLAM